MSEKFEELYNTWLRVHQKQGPRGAAKELPEKIARLEEFKATWVSGNALRRNAVTKKGYCGPLTVRELVMLVAADCVSYPKGLDTPLCIEGPDGTSCTSTLCPAPGGVDGKHLCIRSGTPQAAREICVTFVAAKTMDGGWEERRQISPSDIKDERFTLGRREAAMAITCPFCGTVTKAHKWILTGRGKRCSNPKCRALFSLDHKKGV
jgi:hypothetical protein